MDNKIKKAIAYNKKVVLGQQSGMLKSTKLTKNSTGEYLVYSSLSKENVYRIEKSTYNMYNGNYGTTCWNIYLNGKPIYYTETKRYALVWIESRESSLYNVLYNLETTSDYKVTEQKNGYIFHHDSASRFFLLDEQDEKDLIERVNNFITGANCGSVEYCTKGKIYFAKAKEEKEINFDENKKQFAKEYEALCKKYEVQVRYHHIEKKLYLEVGSGGIEDVCSSFIPKVIVDERLDKVVEEAKKEETNQLLEDEDAGHSEYYSGGGCEGCGDSFAPLNGEGFCSGCRNEKEQKQELQEKVEFDFEHVEKTEIKKDDIVVTGKDIHDKILKIKQSGKGWKRIIITQDNCKDFIFRKVWEMEIRDCHKCDGKGYWDNPHFYGDKRRCRECGGKGKKEYKKKQPTKKKEISIKTGELTIHGHIEKKTKKAILFKHAQGENWIPKSALKETENNCFDVESWYKLSL